MLVKLLYWWLFLFLRLFSRAAETIMIQTIFMKPMSSFWLILTETTCRKNVDISKLYILGMNRGNLLAVKNTSGVLLGKYTRIFNCHCFFTDFCTFFKINYTVAIPFRNVKYYLTFCAFIFMRFLRKLYGCYCLMQVQVKFVSNHKTWGLSHATKYYSHKK